MRLVSDLLGRVLGNRPLGMQSGSWVRFSGGPLKGREFYADLRVPEWRAMSRGEHEEFVFESLGENDGWESKTVWDVGAFMGYHALAFAALVGPAGHVVTFEPNPHNVERIKTNLSRNSDLSARIQIVTDALSNQDGKSTFYLSSSVDTGHSSGSHLVKAFAPEEPSVYQSFVPIQVQTVTADTMMREGQTPLPSLIKIDVEGAELMVLEGAVEVLSQVRPKLLIEMHHIVTMFETQKLLVTLGYELTIVSIDEASRSRCHVLAKPREG